MLLAIDPLIAAGVVLATAATDAVYVMFTSAVVAQTGACGKLEQRLVSALVFRGDPLHRELGLRGFRGRWLVDWGVRHHELHASTDRRSAGRCRTRLTPGDLRLVHQQSCDCRSAYSEDEELEHKGKPTIWLELVDSHIQYESDAPDREHVKESQHHAAPSRCANYLLSSPCHSYFEM